MAAPAFCTVDDLISYEPDIMELASSSGHFNIELTAARSEITDRLIIGMVIENEDKLGPLIFPRQLRLPAIFLTLANIFRNNAHDDESPYLIKYTNYKTDFDNTLGKIDRLDLDQDEDGVLDEDEQNSSPSFSGLMRRR